MLTRVFAANKINFLSKKFHSSVKSIDERVLESAKEFMNKHSVTQFTATKRPEFNFTNYSSIYDKYTKEPLGTTEKLIQAEFSAIFGVSKRQKKQKELTEYVRNCLKYNHRELIELHEAFNDRHLRSRALDPAFLAINEMRDSPFDVGVELQRKLYVREIYEEKGHNRTHFGDLDREMEMHNRNSLFEHLVKVYKEVEEVNAKILKEYKKGAKGQDRPLIEIREDIEFKHEVEKRRRDELRKLRVESFGASDLNTDRINLKYDNFIAIRKIEEIALAYPGSAKGPNPEDDIPCYIEYMQVQAKNHDIDINSLFEQMRYNDNKESIEEEEEEVSMDMIGSKNYDKDATLLYKFDLADYYGSADQSAIHYEGEKDQVLDEIFDKENYLPQRCILNRQFLLWNS